MLTKFGGQIATAPKEIDMFFAKDKIVFAKVDKRNYPTSINLKKLEHELNHTFIRIHKSYLINKLKIKSIHFREDKVEVGEEQLPIGYAYKKAFLKKVRLMK